MRSRARIPLEGVARVATSVATSLADRRKFMVRVPENPPQGCPVSLFAASRYNPWASRSVVQIHSPRLKGRCDVPGDPDTPAPLSWGAAPALPLLPAGETHLFAFPLDPAPPRVAALERLLSRDERDRAGRFHQERDRRRYVVGRGQLRIILGRVLNGDAGALAFRSGPHGKPALQGSEAHARLRFNLSRSHELGVLAIQWDEEVGVDVEHVRPFPDALDIAKRFFAPEEYEALRALPTTELDAGFVSYWTRKEAVVKSLGLGLAHPMGAFVLARSTTAAGERVVIRDAGETRSRWVVPLPAPARDYVAAVATARPPGPLRCWTWSDNPALGQGRT